MIYLYTVLVLNLHYMCKIVTELELHSSIFCSVVHVLDLKVEGKTTVDLTVLQLTVEL